MENVEIDVNSGASSAPAPEAIAPQTEQTVEQVENQPAAATVAEQPVVSETIPLVRLKQIEEERDYWRQKTEALFEKVVKGEPQKPVIPQADDPYVGMDAETERAYRALDARMEKIVEARAQKLAEPLMRQTQILMEHFSNSSLREFRSENPDILPGSAEEKEIVSYLNAGMPKEKAVWAVMGPKRADAKKTVIAEDKKVKTAMKAAANLETQAVPKSNGLPEKKLSFLEEIEQGLSKASF